MSNESSYSIGFSAQKEQKQIEKGSKNVFLAHEQYYELWVKIANPTLR